MKAAMGFWDRRDVGAGLEEADEQGEDGRSADEEQRQLGRGKVRLYSLLDPFPGARKGKVSFSSIPRRRREIRNPRRR